jgi:16S rRNA (cytosine1402-N4)-methyltransferase
VQRRQREPITTTGQLAAVVASALWTPGGKHPARHPATRTFQALRMAVNHELDNLRDLLAAAPGSLRKEGAIAIISYHSLEDGLVKRDFREKEHEGIYRIRTKKPLTPGRAEIAVNRRARSAKLRIAQKA